MIQNETLRIDPELKENHPARYRRSDSQLSGIVSMLLYSLNIGPMYGYVQELFPTVRVCICDRTCDKRPLRGSCQFCIVCMIR